MQQANGTILSINFGGTFVRLGVFENGEKVFSDEFNTPQHPDSFPMEVMRRLQGVGLNNIDFIGVGAAGVWDDNCQLQQSIHLPHYIGYPIWENISCAFEAPLFLKTDVELEVIGEAIVGQKGAYDHLLYINIGTGFSAAYYKDGEVFTTPHSPTLRLEYMARSDFMMGNEPLQTEEEIRLDKISTLASTLINLALIMSPEIILLGGGKTRGEKWEDIIAPAIEQAELYLAEVLVYPIKIQKALLKQPALFGGLVLVNSSIEQSKATKNA